MVATSHKDPTGSRQARMVAIVMIATFALWMAAQWLGPELGLAGRYVFLVDFAALAAFFWAFIVTLQIRRKRRENQG